MTDTRVVTKEEFQEKKFYFSFSSMSKLLKDPKLFYNDYILRERDDADHVYFKEGQLLHCFVLNPEDFDDEFIVLSKSAPTGTVKDVADHVFKRYLELVDPPEDAPIRVYEGFQSDILNALIELNKFQSLKSDDGRLTKMCTQEAIEYFELLQEGRTKTIVDMDMVTKAKGKADAIRRCPKAMELLTTKDIENDMRFEMELEADIPDSPFGLKGILDAVKIDYKNQTIYITDLKTTSKTLDDFIKSLIDYKYWLQAIIYKELVLDLVPKDSDGDWKIVVHFLVIDKNNNVYPFPVSEISWNNWEKAAIQAIAKARWHFDEHVYDLPYDYEHGLVEL